MAIPEYVGGFTSSFDQNRACEVERLVKVAEYCGYEKDTALFDRLLGIVYGGNNQAEFLLKFSELMANIVKSNKEDSNNPSE